MRVSYLTVPVAALAWDTSTCRSSMADSTRGSRRDMRLLPPAAPPAAGQFSAALVSPAIHRGRPAVAKPRWTGGGARRAHEREVHGGHIQGRHGWSEPTCSRIRRRWSSRRRRRSDSTMCRRNTCRRRNERPSILMHHGIKTAQGQTSRMGLVRDRQISPIFMGIAGGPSLASGNSPSRNR